MAPAGAARCGLMVSNARVVAPAAISMASAPPNKTILDIGHPPHFGFPGTIVFSLANRRCAVAHVTGAWIFGHASRRSSWKSCSGGDEAGSLLFDGPGGGKQRQKSLDLARYYTVGPKGIIEKNVDLEALAAPYGIFPIGFPVRKMGKKIATYYI
jgi:hypothetical protein